ncbi:MAG TPA: glycosyltransferase family 39 protein [Solirubrobacterales bacterium]|nr:glycosyltransferase family 39 protein [Solirubrobacterales bacterium]
MGRELTPSRSAVGMLASIALAKLALHLILSGRYGYWIDELYFLACGDHLAWGYVDMPPFVAAVARASRVLLGDSLPALRLFPAVSGALLIFLAGRIAWELGGGRFAQLAAAVAVLVAPVYLALQGVLTMNAFEPLFWMTCTWIAIRTVRRENPSYWLPLGLVAGVGFLNKYSIAFLVIALGVGLLLTVQRRLLFTGWTLAGALVALLIAFPNLLWQIGHGWPTLELLRNAKLYQHQPVTPLEFVWGQIQIVHPLTFPLWLAGAVFLLLHGSAQPFRFLGWTFVVLFVWFMALQAKTYYLAPIYPLPVAAGSVALERLSARPRLGWLRPATLATLLVGGALLAPYVLPVLPISTLPKYLALLPMKEVRPETRRMGEVPQIFADELGWEPLVAEVAKVYESLPPDERARATIWGAGYGEAGAIDFFGRRYRLPAAVSGHQNYHLWGPGDGSGEVVIAVNIPEAYLKPWFERVVTRATVSCDHCMPDRRRMPITVCRGLGVPIREFWPKVKCWTCDRPDFVRAPRVPHAGCARSRWCRSIPRTACGRDAAAKRSTSRS